MKRLYRLFALCLLAALALSACQAAPEEPETADSGSPVAPPPDTEYDPPVRSDPVETVDAWESTIAYIPLDDRPDNVERVVYLAESAGYRIVFPDEDLFSTRLDGQQMNENGTQYGDRAALLEWVRAADEAGCDLFLLSLDQLLSGGLVNSRAMSESEDITFSDGTVLSETAAVDEYLLSLADDPNNRVYIFDSLMRLASTVGYNGYDLEHYNAIRAYGNIARPALTEAELTLDAVVAAYPWGADGTTKAEQLVEDDSLRALLTEDVTGSYLAARERKLRLIDQVLQATAGKNQFYFLIGVDDSSDQVNVQTNEMAYLEQALDGRGLIVNGVDDLGMMLVARIAVDDAAISISAYVEYIGGMENEPTTMYDHQILSDTVLYHIQALGGTQTDDPAQADLQIVVLTAPADETQSEIYCQALVSLLSENLSQGIPTIYIDASSNQYAELDAMLLEQVPLGSLLGFSGFCDLAIIAGAGVSQGFARYACLVSNPEAAAESADSFVQSLAVGMVLATPYKATAKVTLDSYISSELGLSTSNILGTAEQMQLIQDKLEQTLLPACEALCGNLSESPVLIGTDGETAGPFSVSITDPYLPWNRTFEVCFTISVE